MKTIFILSKIIFICSLLLFPVCGRAQDMTIEYLRGGNYDLSASPVRTLLEFEYVPNNGMTNLDVLDIKTVDYQTFDLDGYTNAYGGYHKLVSVDGETRQSQVWFADDAKIYSFWAGLDSEQYKQAFFSSSVLSRFGLGTVEQRRAKMFGLNTFNIVPIDFASVLGGWVVVGLSIAIAIPFLYMLRRFLK